MRLGLATSLLLVGCAYDPGSFRYQRTVFGGAQLELGCIDLAIARTAAVDETGGVVVRYQFGNRCDRPQTIDLLHVHVVGTTADGHVAQLESFDPDEELEPLPLDGRSAGAEAVAYRDPDGGRLVRACVDAASVVHVGAPRWVCVALATREERTAPASSVPTAAPASAVADPDYVGHRDTTQFGAWAAPMKMPNLIFDWGMAGRSVAESGVLVGAITTNLRIGYVRPSGIYLGFEGELGGTGDGKVFAGGYLLTGVRGALGPVSLSAELASGGRVVQSQLTDINDDVPPPMPGDVEGEGVIEARARAELWLNPWFSFGLTAGDNLVNRREEMGGAFFSFHTRAFGGDRARR